MCTCMQTLKNNGRMLKGQNTQTTTNKGVGMVITPVTYLKTLGKHAQQICTSDKHITHLSKRISTMSRWPFLLASQRGVHSSWFYKAQARIRTCKYTYAVTSANPYFPLPLHQQYYNCTLIYNRTLMLTSALWSMSNWTASVHPL